MTYTTDRGVTVYHDRETPPEYATGRDEDAARFNDARDRAFSSVEPMFGLLDNLYSDPIPDKAREMDEIADALAALLVRVRGVTGDAA